ncbi:TetR/AcrR family transcriptional regulator [Myxosarcina sp. GI1]|uniref:TetR/AcrR family transcriptional regulator n=1 Tax=Myxosarcina sp. GI1 TaxID=1541065 RepID=UPI00055B2357|nr:TetR/AcrR family transcriptional regulator [Myxosarcina sp. GI1]
MKRTNKRNELIRVGSDIVLRQGFKAASLNDILTTAGVPKGSFYYYFSSKEDFGLAIIDDFASRYEDRLKNLLEDKRFSPLTRLHNYFMSGIKDMEACQYAEGCLIGNLAQELSAQNELFRDRLNRVFVDWEQYFVRCLKEAHEAGEIPDNNNFEDLAKFIVSSWEGAILKAKVTKSTVPMQTFAKILFRQILGKSDFS